MQTEVQALRAQGKHVVVLTPKVGGAFGWPGVAARLRESPWRSAEAIRWAIDARAELRRRSPDKVIVHWAIPCGWPIASDLGVPIEIVSHGADVRLLRALPGRARVFIVERLLKNATVWRFVSESLRDDLMHVLPKRVAEVLREKSFVEPSPITLPDVSKQISETRAAIGRRRLLVCVGRLVPSKRVDQAIHFAKAQTKVGSDSPVLVIVGDGPERARLEALAQSLGIDARFVGQVDRQDSLAWIGAADELIHASRAEGFSTVLREAKAMGTSVSRI